MMLQPIQRRCCSRFCLDLASMGAKGRPMALRYGEELKRRVKAAHGKLVDHQALSVVIEQE